MEQSRAEAFPPVAEPRDEPPLTDWTLVPFEATGLSALWIAVGIVVFFTAICQIFRAVTEDLDPAFWSHPYFWIDVLNGVLIAYPPTATALLRRGRLRDLRDLRPVLSCNDADFAQVQARTVCVAPHRLALAGFAGAILFAAMPVFDSSYWETSSPDLSDPVMIFHIARMSLTGWLVGHAVVTEVIGTAALRWIGAERLRVDLFDLQPLAPFARSGQRSAFTWVLASSLVSLFWLSPVVGASNAVIIAIILLLVTVGFFFSIYGAHQSIHAAKQKALGDLNVHVQRTGRELMEGRRSPEAPPMADLIAFHDFLARVREWPIGAPAIVRGGLIAALAVGSWLGGALVERLIERALA